MTESKGIKIKPGRTISFKLSLFTAFLVFVFIIVITVILVQMNKIKLEEGLKAAGNSLALTLSSTSASAVISNDYLFIQDLPEMVSHEPDLLYLILVDDKNKCLVHTEEKFLDKLLKDKISQNALQFSKIKKPYIQEYYHQDSGYKAYDIAIGIGVTDQKWATLRVGLSTRRLTFAIKEIYLRGLIIGVIVALFSFLISFLASKKITSTIFVFKDKLDQLQKDEKVEELTLKTGDEMEEITNSFNKVLKTWRRLQENLKESKEYAEELFENATDAIYTHDLNGNITSINKAAERQIGYTKEEVLKANISDILPPEDLKIAKQQIKDKVEGKPTKQPYELEVIKKDGTKAVWELATRLIVRNGKPVGIQGIARDITERKKMEEILMVSEERFRRLFETAPDIIFRWDPERGIGYINPAVEIITGYTQKEIIGNMEFLESIFHPEDMPLFIKELQSAGEKDGKIKSIEIRMIAKNGSIIWMEVRFVPIWDGQGNFLEMECIIRDISERRGAEEELKKKMRDLEELKR